ncbi:MerR family transcriptional regulator [Kutzneria viridogrisea]|uniref:HTH merR-type domain-containing protein n=2 Tax=Kutzneria TaxID=43356 RepID=W5VYQ5_9PSEU|nr:MerR family transcriptional regulator [Kutzneria albida]AHH93441.1 hypothetical protein KALB_64 [Kutzneria albida DSM 43870]MBA8929174.1 DNA-binding transcriptional MerR regulator [Kutzneria viridogrisea]
MRIGELAELTGTSTRSLRYYEEQGLLSARRDAKGYREYDEADLRAVREIRSLLAIGFGLEDTRPFVACLRAGGASGDSCPDSVAVYRRKLAEIDDCIDRLQAVRTQLARSIDRCSGERRCCPR